MTRRGGAASRRSRKPFRASTNGASSPKEMPACSRGLRPNRAGGSDRFPAAPRRAGYQGRCAARDGDVCFVAGNRHCDAQHDVVRVALRPRPRASWIGITDGKIICTARSRRRPGSGAPRRQVSKRKALPLTQLCHISKAERLV
jgi:hypothetical protein